MSTANPPTREYYYMQGGQQQGPVSLDELKGLIAARRLTATDMVWKNGMANWVPANSIPGLFPPAAVAAVPVGAAPPQQPRSAVAAGVDSAFDSFRRGGAAPQTTPSKGMSKGLKWGLIGGGVGLFLLILIIIGAVSGGGNSRSFTLKVGQKSDYDVRFEKGKRVDIDVKCDKKYDIDLFVLNGKTILAADTRFDADCRVSFVPGETKTYTVRVINPKHPPQNASLNGTNSGTVTWTVAEKKRDNGE